MTPRAVRFLLLAVACAAPRESWHDRTPEVFVEVLPQRAQLELDGRVLGPGSRTVPVPEPGRRYLLRASAPGFEPAETAGDGAKLAGARVTVILRPEGYGAARRLDAADPGSVAQAALALLRAGRLDEAREYADRSLELGEVPLAHKVLGAVAERQGDRRKAAQQYSIYLSLVPDAPDARTIAEAVERDRGDLTVPASGGAPAAAPARGR